MYLPPRIGYRGGVCLCQLRYRTIQNPGIHSDPLTGEGIVRLCIHPYSIAAELHDPLGSWPDRDRRSQSGLGIPRHPPYMGCKYLRQRALLCMILLMYVYTNVDTPPRQVTAEPVKHFTLDQCLKGKTIPWMWIAPGTPLLGARCRGT